MTDYIQIITTTEKKEDAEKIARALLEQKLAGCVQIVGPITSMYWWKDAIETAGEWLCLIKTSAALYTAVEKAIKAVHPYEVPEILAMAVVEGNQNYLDWLAGNVKPT